MQINNRNIGIILSYTSTFLNMICGLFLSSFLLRSLGDWEYGLYQTISSFVNYLVVFQFGIGGVLCRNLLVAQKSNDSDAAKKNTATIWYISIFLSVLISVVGILFCKSLPLIYVDNIPDVQMKYAQKLFLILLCYLVISFLSQTVSGVFLGNENYLTENLISILRILLRTVLLVLFCIRNPQSLTIAWIDTVVSIAVLLFSIVYVKRKYVFSFDIRFFDRTVIKNSLPLCIAMLLQAITTQANNNVDKFIISIKMDMESVAVYSVAMYIYSMFSSLTNIPISMYMPQIARSINNGVYGKELTETLVPSGRLVALIGGTILFGFIAVGKPFIHIVYGEQYGVAWITALIILIPMFINMTGGGVINVLDILNKRQIRSYILMFTTVLNILLTIWIIDYWGFIGAAVATAFSLIFGQVILINIYYYKVLSINMLTFYRHSYKGIFLSEVFATGIGFGVSSLFANNILSFFLGGISFVISEMICLFKFGFNQNEKERVLFIWKRLRTFLK